MKLSVNNLPNFADIFKQYKDQAEADNAWPIFAGTFYKVDPALNKIDYRHAQSIGDQAVSHDLGSVISDNWTLRGKLTLDVTTIGSSSYTVFLTIADDPNTVANAQNNALGVGLLAGTGFQSFRSVLFEATSFSSTIGTPNNYTTGTFYFEIIRSGVLLTINIYRDVDFTDLLETFVENIPAGITGLRFIRLTAANNASYTGDEAGTITQIEFWDNEVPRTPINNVPNFEDDFEINKGWVKDAGTLISVNTIQNTIDWDSTPLTAYDEVLTFDLGSAVSETLWTLRCKVTQLVVNSTSANGFQFGIGLSNNISNSSGGQDWIGSRYVFSNTQDFSFMSTANNTDIRSNAFPVGNLPNAVGVVHFLEIRRLTATTAIINIYADAEFTQLLGTTGEITITIGITALRFLKVWVRSTSITNGEFSGTIEDIELFTDKGATKIQDWRANNG